MVKVYDNATDLITFARLQAQNTTSGSSYLGSDGLLKFAAEDEPRIEYAADGSLKGLLIEEQRTNLVTSSAQGIYGSSPGSTQQTTGPDGSTGDYVPVPDAGSNRFQYSIGAGDFANGTELTVSWFAKRLAATPSSYAGELRLSNHVGVSVGTAYEVGASADGWTRYAATVTVTDNSAQQLVRMYFGDIVGVGNANMAYFGFQLEEGSFATSYIPTSGSQSTRSADIASIPVSAFGYNDQAGTIVVEAVLGEDTFSGLAALQPTISSATERISFLRTSSTALENVVATAAGIQAQQFEAVAANNTAVKAAMAFTTNSVGSSFNGSIEVEDTSAAMPTTISVLMIGRYSASFFANGHIKSLKYFPRRLTNTQLQELTS